MASSVKSLRSDSSVHGKTEMGTVHPVSTIPADGDVAAQYAAEGEIQLTPEMDRRLRFKADVYIMPIISVLYGIQFADKLIPSSAQLLGLMKLFSSSSTGYSWVGSSFYLGYLVFEFPMSYLMQKMPLAWYASVVTVSWGILLTCTAACQGMESFLACRVLLGMLESGIQPAFTVVVAQWYRRSETFSRTMVWFAGNGMGGILVTSIAYGLAVHTEHNPNAYGIDPWRLMYIIMGCITIGLGVALFLLLPNNPHEARFLSEDEKRFQVERIRHNNQGFGSHHIKRYQIVEGLLDVRTWLYGISEILGTIPNGGITVFSTLILNGMGYEGKEDLLMNLPTSAVEFGGALIIAFVASFWLAERRMLYVLVGAAITVVCLCLVAWGPNVHSQLAGLYLYGFSSVIVYGGLISMIESDIAGTTKKVTSNAILLMCYCAGNVIGPQVFFKSEAPYYPTGKTTMAAAQAAQLALLCVLMLLNYFENKRRDRKGITEPPEDFINAEFADLTDKEMPWFRYSL